MESLEKIPVFLLKILICLEHLKSWVKLKESLLDMITTIAIKEHTKTYFYLTAEKQVKIVTDRLEMEHI